MKYSTYIWRTDFFSDYKRAIQESSLKVLLEIVLLVMTLIFIPICIVFLAITIPTDISRISIAIVLRVKRKIFFQKDVYVSLIVLSKQLRPKKENSGC